MVPVLSQMILVHKSSKLSHPFRLPTEMYAFVKFLTRATSPAHLIILDWTNCIVERKLLRSLDSWKCVSL